MTIYHRILVSESRRIAIEILGKRCDAVSLHDLADEISKQVDHVDSEQIAIELHHNHLPLLDDVGAIHFDVGQQLITPKPRVIREINDVSVSRGAPEVMVSD